MAPDPQRWRVRNEGEGTLRLESQATGRVQGRRYYVQKERFVAPFGRALPPLLDDLIDLALTVYAADRLIRRRPPGATDDHRHWQRHFEIDLPVSSPGHWMQAGVHHLLTDTLSFLTEDRWEFKFLPRPASVGAGKIQAIIFPPEPPVGAGLFSGGLDSLAGLALDLSRGEFKSMTVLTCSSNARLLRQQRKLLNELTGQLGVRLIPVVVPARLRQPRRDYNHNERSQRSRGFLFGVLGCVTSLMAGGRELAVYENGVGSVNLPISAAQLGAESSRSVHPVALLKLERLLREVLGTDFRFRLPFLFSTKGEMCQALRITRFSKLAPHSVSCDGFPARVRGPEHCGTCTSCLLRRQALWIGGFDHDREAGRYRRDVLRNPEALKPAHLAPLWDMLDQVEKMEEAFQSPSPWRNLTVAFPELLETRDAVTDWLRPTSKAVVEEKLTALYRKYSCEWQEFPARPPGWKPCELRRIA